MMVLLLLLGGCTATIQFPADLADDGVRECPALFAWDDPAVWVETRIATPYPICLKARL